MKEILGSLFEPIRPLIDTFAANLPMLIGVVLAVAMTIYVVVRITVRYTERWKLNGKKLGGSRRILKPRTWFALLPAHLFKAQTEILKSYGIREFYAPAPKYIVDREPKKLYVRTAWLSPYSGAVKVTIDQNEDKLRGKHMLARKQIRKVAKCVHVRPLPVDVFIGGDQSKHMLVELGLDDHPKGAVGGLADHIESKFHAHSVEKYDAKRHDLLSYIVHLVEPQDILIERKFGVEFFNEHPAATPYSLPLAVMENGQPWCLDIHHTLIYGMTGAGKGGPIQGTIRQLAPFVKEGRVQLYGIDPKGPELGAYAKKGVKMFERISIGLAEENIRQHVKTINQIAAIIASRGNSIEPDFRDGHENLNRSVKATKETPWVVLFIDEYLTLVKGLKKLGKEGAAPLATLDQILATGRSFGVYVILATQVATKEVFGDVRDNIPNAIVLKHKAGNYWTTEFLGEDALELGLDPKKIGPSNESNGYETAGIGYVATPGGVVRVRFGYLSDKDIVEIAKQFMEEGADLGVFKEPLPYFDPKDYGLEISQEEADAMDGIFEDGDDGNFGITEEPAAETDDFLLALDDFTKGKGGRRN